MKARASRIIAPTYPPIRRSGARGHPPSALLGVPNAGHGHSTAATLPSEASVSNLAGECSWKFALEIYSFGHRL